jgi:hypothetical protein
MGNSMKSMPVVPGIPRSLFIVLLLLTCGVLLAQNQKHGAVQITHVTIEPPAWTWNGGMPSAPEATRSESRGASQSVYVSHPKAMVDVIEGAAL